MASAISGLIWPRSIIEFQPDHFIVADAVGWYARRRGVIFLLDVGRHGDVRLTPLFSNRNLPHGLALGPDNRVYVGDDDKIWRFDPKHPETEPTIVIDGLPGKNFKGGDEWHPFKQILFDRHNDLIINFGAPSDICEKPNKRSAAFPCPRSEGSNPDAALWKLNMKWPEGTPQKYRPIARGLRNSMAVAIRPGSSQLIQAENNIDEWDDKYAESFPPEEINLIEEGKHYGWPYCVGYGKIVPEYLGKAICANYQNPFALLPAHSAPLAMSYYNSEMFPDLNGKLIIAFHGISSNGHRIVVYDVDAGGLPTKIDRAGFLMGKVLVGTSPSAPSNILRPSSLAIAHDGSIWLVDDKSRAIMVIMRESGDSSDILDNNQQASTPRPSAPTEWEPLYHNVMSTKCSSCHVVFGEKGSDSAWRKLQDMGFIDARNLNESLMFRAILSGGGVPDMPPRSAPPLSATEISEVRKFLERSPSPRPASR